MLAFFIYSVLCFYNPAPEMNITRVRLISGYTALNNNKIILNYIFKSNSQVNTANFM